MTDPQLLAETEDAVRTLRDGILTQLRGELAALATKPPRDLLWAVVDPIVLGVHPVRYTLFRPHYLAGVTLSSMTATTAITEIDIERSTDGGGTWASIFTTRPTIAAGKFSGGAMINVNSNTANVGGVAGTIGTTLLNAGTLLRLNVIGAGGATGLVVQLQMETRLDLGRVHLPTMTGFTPV